VAESDVLDTSAAGPAAMRGGALRSTGYAASVLLSLIAAPILIRHLGVAGFGRYATVLAIVTLASGVTEGGVNIIALREWSTRKDAHRRDVFRQLLGVRIAFTLAGAAVAVAFTAAAGYPDAVLVGTMVASVGMLMQVLQSLLVTPLQVELRFGWITAIELTRQAVAVALIVVLSLTAAGMVAFLATIIPATAVALTATVVLTRHKVPLRPSFDWPRWRVLLRETLPFAAAIAASIVYFRVALIVMSLLGSANETGYFATAFRVVEVVAGVPPLVIGAAFPLLARAHRDDTQRFDYAVRRLLVLSCIAGAGVALLLVVGAPIVIPLLGGDAARPAIGVLRIQGAAVAATFVALAAGYPLLTLRRYGALLRVTLAALVVALVASLVLVPVADAKGAALATLASELTAAIGMVAALYRQQPAVAGALRAFPLIVGSALAVGGAAIGSGLPAGFAIAVAIVGFPLMLVAVRQFPPELRDALGRRRA